MREVVATQLLEGGATALEEAEAEAEAAQVAAVALPARVTSAAAIDEALREARSRGSGGSSATADIAYTQKLRTAALAHAKRARRRSQRTWTRRADAQEDILATLNYAASTQ